MACCLGLGLLGMRWGPASAHCNPLWGADRNTSVIFPLFTVRVNRVSSRLSPACLDQTLWPQFHKVL